ncbi:hypothetical protein ABZ912_06045 [Nonomuraea angiospora]|uniref:hypothetical protein n=1 Tax=Nonomuraea angiospora TaxID=46172 RepID=UPI0033DCE62A
MSTPSTPRSGSEEERARRDEHLRDDDLPDERPGERFDGRADEDAHADGYARADQDARADEYADDRKLAGDGSNDVHVAGDDRVPGDVRVAGDDEPERHSPRAGDEYAAAVPGAVTPPTAEYDAEYDDGAYRDPYARTGGDTTAGPETEPGELPAHAAPEDVVLFDQDPDQVQARWRDLQASFVDDPGEAVRRADGLVGEVVDALTSSLTTRTNGLRDRWKDSEAADTEQMRLALRDYRSVLERLLALSGHQTRSQGQTTQLQTWGKR